MLYLTLLWFGQRHWWYYENSKLFQIIESGCHGENTCNYIIRIAPVLKINQLIPIKNVNWNTIEETFLEKSLLNSVWQGEKRWWKITRETCVGLTRCVKDSSGSKLLASPGHTGRGRVVLGQILNVETLTKTNKSHNGLNKFTILCWDAFIALLGHVRPLGSRLDTPARDSHEQTGIKSHV